MHACAEWLGNGVIDIVSQLNEHSKEIPMPSVQKIEWKDIHNEW